MGEEKFASLSSGLLARKGAAKPAMRRQGYMNPQGDVADDLGWNDMGHDGPEYVEQNGAYHYHQPEPPEVHRQLDQLSEDYETEDFDAEDGAEQDMPALGGHAGLSAMGEGEVEPEIISDDVGDEPVDETAEAADAGTFAEDEPEQVEQTPVAEVIPMRPQAPETQHEHILARDKVAFTLRLDKERHLKLRLASALENRSAQLLVTEALDEFFKGMPDLDRLAANSRDRK